MTFQIAPKASGKLSIFPIRTAVVYAWIFGAVIVSGCGSSLAGTYNADARLLEGREDLMEPGYSLSDIQARINGGKRTLKLLRSGRYEWNTGNGLNEGNWRVDGTKLILRDDIVGGTQISPALQLDRIWEIRADGEIISTGSYNAYSIEEFYTAN